jgi:poly(hydroxyalkanoate) granule-associated protein
MATNKTSKQEGKTPSKDAEHTADVALPDAADVVNTVKDRAEDAADRVAQAGRNLAIKADKLVKVGTGAIESARTQASETFGSLVERGRKSGVDKKISGASKKARKQAKESADRAVDAVTDPVKKAAGRISEATASAEKTITEVVADSLRRMNVPSTDDVRRLRSSVEELSDAVDKLASS